jgi:hypothetical protein
VANEATGTVDQVANEATGTIERTANASAPASGGASVGASANGRSIVEKAGDAVPEQDGRPSHVLELAPNSPAGAPAYRVMGGGQRVFRGARVPVDPQDVRLLPPGHLTEVIAVGNQLGGETGSDDEMARRVGVRGWLPQWLPSLLAFTGFAVLVLLGIGLGLIKCGVVAVSMSR